MGSPAPPILLQLPQEIQNDIYSVFEADDIKNLRVTCSAFHEALPLHFDRVFISANSLNIDVFNEIASHETFRHQVSEIIWDDARLRMGPELEQERQEYEEDGNDPEDAAAENATHGRLWQPLYRTPMVRAFPPGFDYPLPQAWPSFDDEKLIDALPWVSEDGNDPYQNTYGAECTAEAYRAKWCGFRLVTRALVECEDRTITELVIGVNKIQSGLNCRIFDQRSTEYDDFVAFLKRPGFRYLGLHLFTGLLEDNDWVSYNTGHLHDALAQATDLEHFSLRTSMEVSHGAPQQLVPDVEGHVFPVRTIFPIDHWPHLRHFGI
uniref:F-box domain-containing protein n=1 Tax=Fusarium oxysporum (strain Fo5176) TaxID=660025 RepID=A0A0D2YE86_FUSOF